MRYADLDNLIADYLPEAKSANEQAAVGRILDGVSAFVDKYCRRAEGFFAPNDTESEKRVRGMGDWFLRLPVHQIGSVSRVTLDGSVIDSAEYYESEKNGWLYLENNGSGLENTFFSSCANRWIDGRVYRVTAKWGYSETPLDLQEAVRLIVVRIYETQRGTLGQINPAGFVIERLIPPAAKEILDNYRRRQFEV